MSMVILGLIIGNAVLLGKSYFVDTEENTDELKNIKSIMKQQTDIIRSSEASDNMDMRGRRNIDHYQGWEQVTDLINQLPEFLFDCLSKKDPWIIPCSSERKYLMIFDSQGNFFQEKTKYNVKYLSSTHKKIQKPMGMQMTEIDGHPDYLFQLEHVEQNRERFYIATKSTTNATRSGLLLIAGNEANTSLLLKEDHCGRDSISSSAKSPIAIAAPNMDYACHQAEWRLWKVDKRFLLIESVNKQGFFLNVDTDSHLVSLGNKSEKLTGIYTSFISHMTLDQSEALDESEKLAQAEAGIGPDAYGDLVVHYF